ncbi:hypothetical protein C8R47DRAFT_1064440 [Mycena vitilis]|nr:hypothetical protein C8R47DRAFT_1064440 [Mycena vitilis]
MDRAASHKLKAQNELRYSTSRFESRNENTVFMQLRTHVAMKGPGGPLCVASLRSMIYPTGGYPAEVSESSKNGIMRGLSRSRKNLYWNRDLERSPQTSDKGGEIEILRDLEENN